MSTSYNELNIPFVPLGSCAKRQMYLVGPILLMFKSLHEHLLSIKLLYANTARESAPGYGQQPATRRTQYVSHASNTADKVPRGPVGVKGGHSATEPGDSNGMWTWAEQGETQWLQRGRLGAPGFAEAKGRPAPHQSQLPASEMGFSVAPAGKEGILREPAKPRRWHLTEGRLEDELSTGRNSSLSANKRTRSQMHAHIRSHTGAQSGPPCSHLFSDLHCLLPVFNRKNL